jgi:septal ring factor EnvC (AmiA/AmiB activator)
MAVAAPPAPASARHPAHLQSQVKDVDAKLAAARSHNEALQAQVTQMEQHNATQQKQLQQRDAEIAALQDKLQAAGVPAPATSAGH